MLKQNRDSSQLRKLTAKLNRMASMVLVATLLLLAVGAGMGLERFVVADSAMSSQQHDELTDLPEFQTLVETYNTIRENYVASDDITDEDLIFGASAGMVDALGDTGHSRFLTPPEAEKERASQRGEFVGIGIQVDYTVSPPVVVIPLPNSPALAAGILPGDEILTVDGEPTTGFAKPEDAMGMLTGEEGTEVTMELRHAGEVDTYEVTITRARFEQKSVFAMMMPNNVMWIRITQFQEGTARELKAALQDGIDQGMEGVLLDLRANPGGLVVEEMSVATQFLPADSVIVQNEDSNGDITKRVTRGTHGLWQEGPLVVLINGDSASAAEVTASAIQDNDRGVLVGQTTFGTGTTLMPVDLSDGSMIWIGYEQFLSADGNVLWHEGVHPDVEVMNEPGIFLALPYLFPDNVMTQDEFNALQDDQLTTGFDEVVKQVSGS